MCEMQLNSTIYIAIFYFEIMTIFTSKIYVIIFYHTYTI